MGEEIPFLFYQDPMPTSVSPKLAPLKGGGTEMKLFATGLFEPFDTPCITFRVALGRKAKQPTIEKVVQARVVLDEKNPDQSYLVCPTPNFKEGNEDIEIPTPCKATMWLTMNGRDYLDKSSKNKPVTITLFDDQVLESTPGCALVGKTAKTLIKFRGIPKSSDLTVQLQLADKTFELKSKIK